MRWISGGVGRVSLFELFERGREIGDLVLEPHERIAVMRLLLCIVHRAIEGPKDKDEREECEDEIIPKSLKYLKQWEHVFNLVSDMGRELFSNCLGWRH